MALAGVLLVLSCGDGAVEPAPPPPAPVATAVTVSPASATLTALEETARLTAEVHDQNGQVMAGAAIAWASSDASVAGVDASGRVTAAGNGSATITATAGSVSGNATVTVAQVVRAVAVSPAADTLVAFGDTVRLAAEATDANGHGVAGSEFSWSSSDTLVARVDNEGLVGSLAEGEVMVAATASDVTGSADLSVVPPLPTTVAVTSDTVVFTALGQTAQLEAEVREQAGRLMAEALVLWSSDDTLVVAVDSAGLVTAVGDGTSRVTATADEVSGAVAVMVEQSAGTVVVSPPEGTIGVGGTLRLATEAFDENGHAVDGATFSWSSSDARVARVDDTGFVEGVAEGTASITAKAGDASGVAEITVENPDRAALVALYSATNGPHWEHNDGWLTDVPIGEWYGVNVDSHGRVVGLSMRFNLLGGPIPSELGSLTELTRLDFGANSLTGPIPSELGKLTQLTYLGLGHNELTGRIPPHFGGLVGLRELHLYDNNLTEAIPPGLGNLADLIVLDLSGNQLTGSIPLELGGLTKLEKLSLGDNQLTGPIPTELNTMSSLRVLAFNDNSLAGTIPTELGTMSSLRGLLLGDNQLSGPIPTELGNLMNLEELSLGDNLLRGPIPSELGGLSRLEYLDFSRNQLTGPIPAELGGLADLSTLYFGYNQLSGSIPAELGGLAKLEWLTFDFNRLTGTIPPTFAQLERLHLIWFGDNDGLCVPSVEPLRSWLEGVPRALGPRCQETEKEILRALYNGTGGPGWPNSEGWLGDAGLEHWYGVETDSPGRVVRLDLSDNGLSGSLPRELGNLSNLESLIVGDNALIGAIPVSLANTRLHEFSYRNTGLCVPDDAGFRDWLSAVTYREGTEAACPPLSDHDILIRLHDATGGPQWIENGNWLSDEPLERWFGVETDAAGRVTGIDLSSNGLVGPLIPELSALEGLENLRLSSNNLHGPIPTEWGDFQGIETLDLGYNDLTGFIPPEIGRLTSLTELALHGNLLRGSIPPELGNLIRLTKLRLGCRDNYSIDGSIPSEFGNLVNLTRLSITSCWRLSGNIPPELGKLTELTVLELSSNRLNGPIPPELGALPNLVGLYLSDNELSGPVPAELGDLSELGGLELGQNELSGTIPRELGKLVALTALRLRGNELSGRVPPDLALLTNLRLLDLGDNQLDGHIPPSLGSLGRLEYLDLDDNDLVGSVPPELGSLSGLRELILSDNAELSGSLPIELTALAGMDIMWASGTDLCAPSEDRFLRWLAGLREHRVPTCADERAAAYLVQAVQSRDFPVPLVANEPALLRVFVAAAKSTQEAMPPIRVTFFVGGREAYVAAVPAGSANLPRELDESSLSKSANAEIPGWVIRPGLEMVIEVDPDRTLNPDLEITRRIPDTGRLAVDVRAVPRLDLTLIPLLRTVEPDTAVIRIAAEMAADPEGHDLLRATRTLLPVGDLAITAHDPVYISSQEKLSLYPVSAIQAIEGGRGHYMGLIERGGGGLAEVGGTNSYASPDSEVIAHELGHNMSLAHAPCAGAGDPDPLFPYLGGRTGAWGYDFENARLVSPFATDLMGYCHDDWISDYHFSKAARYRSHAEERSAAINARPVQSLLLWGGVDRHGGPFLEPAFVVDAPPTRLRAGVEYEIIGKTASGGELFALSFGMPEVADGDGSSSFAFTLPVQDAWANALATITLSGPGGSVVLDRGTNHPMAILRDPRSGQVRGFLRNAPPAAQVAADATARSVGPELEVLFSRGLPDAAAWRR